MPQISHIKYKDILEAHRYDAEFYKPIYLNIEKKLNRINKTLNDFNVQIKHPSEIKREYIESDGLLFVRTQNVRPLSFDLSNKVYISKEDANKLNKNKIRKNDILMTRTGANFGQTCLIEEEIDAIASSHTFLIKSGKINPFLLSVFFNTSYGRKMIDKGMYGGLQPEITPTYLLKIPFFEFPQSFQLQIEEIVKSAHQKQTESKQLYREAEEMLLKEIFGDVTVGNNNCCSLQFPNSLWFSTTKKEIDNARRIDSEYFQPKYDAIIKKIEEYEGGWDYISNIGKFKNGSFISDEYYVSNAKRAYIRIKELSLNTFLQKDDMVFIDDSFVRTNETIVKENDFVFATIGNTIGKVNLITKYFEGSIPSNNTSIFSLKKVKYPLFYETLFRSFIVQEQIQRYFTQTAQPKISNAQLGKIKIPLIKTEIQEEIAKKIQESYKLRKESKELLEEAKRKVEEEIEK